MALMSRLDQGTDKYILDLTNDASEEHLEDGGHSSASDFTILLSPTLNLSSLLYLRSVAAEIAISQLTVDALPLTATKRESIFVNVVVPPDITSCNTWYNPIAITDANEIPFEIPCRDFYTSDPSEIIQYTNATLQEGLTQFLFYRYVCAVLDVDIFSSGGLGLLNVTDLLLVSRYLDIAIYTRNVIHDTMAGLMPDKTFDAIPGKDVIKGDKDGMSRAEEARHIRNSEGAFRKVEDREVPEAGGHRTIQLEQFLGIAFKVAGVTEAVKQTIKTRTLAWLTGLGTVTRDDTTNELVIVEESHAVVEGYILSNQWLVKMGLKCREILENLRSLIDRRKKTDKTKGSLFIGCFLSLQLDPSTKMKCRFHIEKGKYITEDGTSITISLPDQLSYVLGAKPQQKVIIGPIAYDTPENNTPTLSHHILSGNQHLFHSLRPMPQVIHVVSNLVFSKSRDMWLANTPWRNYHLIYTFVLNESNISRHYICQINNNPTYYRVQDVNSILESFSFVMLDQSFRKIVFAPYCRVALRLVVRPVIYGSQ